MHTILELQYFNEAAQMVEHVHRGNGYYLTPRVRARRDARDAAKTSLRRPGCPVQLSQQCAPAAARRSFTMAKRKHKDSTARYVTPQCLIISSQQWQRAPAPTPRRRPAVLLGSRRCDVRRGARLLAGFRWRVTRDLHEVCCILRPRWSLRLDTLRQASSPPLGSDNGSLPGVRISVCFVELFCWATDPVDSPKIPT